MKVTQRLNVEHGVFLSLIDRLEDLAERETPPDVLASVARTVLGVIEPHCRIEDQWLYPTLKQAFGRDFPPLEAVEADHEEIRRLARIVDTGACDAAVVAALVAALRDHIEKEIHLVFPLAEEWIPEEMLTRMCDWYAEHVRERAGQRVSHPSAAWLG